MTTATGPAELLDALARLSRPRREALVLTGVGGLSYAEAAAVCGCPVGTIRSRITRARAELAGAPWPIGAADGTRVDAPGGAE